MARTDRIAIIGHNGWAARKIIASLAAQSFENPLRVLARSGSNTDSVPSGVDIHRYSWDDDTSLAKGLEDIDILL